MHVLTQWLDQLAALVWGGPTAVLLLAAGAYLTFVLRGVQVRELPLALRLAFVVRREPGGEGEISHFQALMLALGGSVGPGTVVGVGTALAVGGPGALLWVWVAGWIAMAIRYSEGVLGVYYREPDRRGRLAGGPMYYLSRGVGGWFGRGLAVWFALFTVLAALGIGSAAPARAAAAALDGALAVPPIVTAVVLAVGAGAVVAGGIRAIGRTVGVLVPILVGVYLVGALAVIGLNAGAVGPALLSVLDNAFTATAAAGGAAGATIREAVRWGLSHGALAAGSGVGTGGIAAAAARTRSAPTQALVAMIQTFLDTVVLATVTGLAILVTDPDLIQAGVRSGLPGVAGRVSAFPSTLPAGLAGPIVSTGLALFAFSTILAWAHFGERSFEYLFGTRTTPLYRGLFVAAVLAGGLVTQLGLTDWADLVWAVSDVVSGGLVLPNIIGLLLLSGVVVRETTRSAGPG